MMIGSHEYHYKIPAQVGDLAHLTIRDVYTRSRKGVAFGGCSDDVFPWERSGDELETKYAYVCHAELNAILNASGRDLRGSRLYVALFPCNECAKAIIQSGVKEVYYLSDKNADSLGTLASKRMLDSAGVRYSQLRTSMKSITLDFVPEEEK